VCGPAVPKQSFGNLNIRIEYFGSRRPLISSSEETFAFPSQYPRPCGVGTVPAGSRAQPTPAHVRPERHYFLTDHHCHHHHNQLWSLPELCAGNASRMTKI
jgi:hypothetical protein